MSFDVPDGLQHRVPPHNVGAEMSVLTGLLLRLTTVTRVAATLRPEDFYRPAHVLIYRAILNLDARGEALELSVVANELAKRSELETIGGIAALETLVIGATLADDIDIDIDQAIQAIFRTAALRQLIAAGTQIISSAYDELLDVDEVLIEAQRTIDEVVETRRPRNFVSVAEVLEVYFDKLDFLQQHRGQIVGVPTGYRDLNQLTGGFQKSDLVILAARPGAGKTAMSLGLAYNAAMAGRRVAIFNQEIPSDEIVQRLLAMETGINSYRLRLGHINDDEWERISYAFGKLSEAQFYIDDTPGIGIMELRSKARRLHRAHGLDFILIDYLQLMQGTQHSRTREQEVSEILRGLKGLARELNVPVLALAQLSRGVHSRASHVPMLSDLMEIGSTEDHADMVMFIYREEMYDPETEKKGVAELHIAKHRNGPVGVVNLRFFDKTTRFADLELYREPD